MRGVFETQCPPWIKWTRLTCPERKQQKLNQCSVWTTSALTLDTLSLWGIWPSSAIRELVRSWTTVPLVMVMWLGRTHEDGLFQPGMGVQWRIPSPWTHPFITACMCYIGCIRSTDFCSCWNWQLCCLLVIHSLSHDGGYCHGHMHLPYGLSAVCTATWGWGCSVSSILKPCWDWLHFALLGPLCDCAKLLDDGLSPCGSRSCKLPQSASIRSPEAYFYKHHCCGLGICRFWGLKGSLPFL